MPPMDRPPMSPQAQAQMGPPGESGFGQGIAQAQQQAQKSPIEVAVSTVEKILGGIQDDTFRPYREKALATLKVGLAMSMRQGPQSGTGAPPQQAPDSKIPTPPIPGQMPG